MWPEARFLLLTERSGILLQMKHGLAETPNVKHKLAEWFSPNRRIGHCSNRRSGNCTFLRLERCRYGIRYFALTGIHHEPRRGC
jgi:hypothetical protein